MAEEKRTFKVVAPDGELKEWEIEVSEVKRDNIFFNGDDLCSCGSGEKYKKCCGTGIQFLSTGLEEVVPELEPAKETDRFGSKPNIFYRIGKHIGRFARDLAQGNREKRKEKREEHFQKTLDDFMRGRYRFYDGWVIDGMDREYLTKEMSDYLKYEKYLEKTSFRLIFVVTEKEGVNISFRGCTVEGVMSDSSEIPDKEFNLDFSSNSDNSLDIPANAQKKEINIDLSQLIGQIEYFDRLDICLNWSARLPCRFYRLYLRYVKHDVPDLDSGGLRIRYSCVMSSLSFVPFV